MSKIHVQRLSALSIAISLALAGVCTLVFLAGRSQFTALRETSDVYSTCENAMTDFRDGIDGLAEQAKLAVLTGNASYAETYLEKLGAVEQKAEALSALGEETVGSSVISSLRVAVGHSDALAEKDLYAMHLVMEASGDAGSWPDAVRDVACFAADEALDADAKLERARALVSNGEYRILRQQLEQNINVCRQALVTQMESRQGAASSAFESTYLELAASVGAFVLLTVLSYFVVRRLVVKPLMRYDEALVAGRELPVDGAAELQNLALTYNRVSRQNKEIQEVIKHQAEHDPLTDLYNRGSFDRFLGVFEPAGRNFALILVDVDTFKTVNDTYGHAAGDKVLKRVSALLSQVFRSIDYVCRIGGDEFAVIMVEMTTDLAYTIEEKVRAVNELLAEGEDGAPAVSISAGVAFMDREAPTGDLYADADRALYFTKEHGRAGCSIYGRDEVVR